MKPEEIFDGISDSEMESISEVAEVCLNLRVNQLQDGWCC